MNFDVIFLEKSYALPKDILTYIEILNMTDDIQKTLFAKFMKKVRSSDVPVISDDYLHNDMKKQAGRFKQKLCENDIYDKTADEYVFENSAYSIYSDLNKNGIQSMASFLQEEIVNFRDGIANAEINAMSNVTGSGIQVYSSSFLTLAATSAMEYSIIKKQAEEADRQYRNEVQAISDRGASIRAGKQNDYLNKTYIPTMEQILSLFAFDMMDKYIRHLTEAGKFNAEALNYVNIKKSQGLLENLKHTQNKAAIYEQAFLACPFNGNLYLSLLDAGLLDSDTYKTATTLKQGEAVVTSLKSNIFNVDCQHNLTSALKYVEKYLPAYVMCTGTSEIEVYHKISHPKYLSVIKGYNEIKSKIRNADECSSLISISEKNVDEISDTQITQKATSEIKSIISNQDFEALVNTCGYTDLLNEISMPSKNFESKSELDTFYINELEQSITKYFEKCKNSIQMAIKAREEMEKSQAKQSRITVIIVALIIVAIVAIVIYFNTFKPMITYNNGIKAMNDKNYADAVCIFEDLGDYSDSQNMILECSYREANDYFQAGNYNDAIAIFKQLKDYSNSKNMILECQYREATDAYQVGNYDKAITAFRQLNDYSDSSDMLVQVKYDKAQSLLNSQKYMDSIVIFEEIKNYKGSSEKINSAYLDLSKEYYSNEKYLAAIDSMKKVNPDNIEFIDECYYKHGEKALAKKDYETALTSFSRIKGEDHTELIAYLKGMILYIDGNYISAIKKFESCQEPYEDMIDKCLNEMYTMVIKNIDNDDYEDIGKYLDCLAEREYKDSVSIQTKVKKCLML